MVGGTTAAGPSPIFMAGIINDHTDAATITPDANPNRNFCINAGMSRFMRNTKDAPNAVPRNGIRSVAKIGFMISFLCSNNAKIQILPHFVNHNYNDSYCQYFSANLHTFALTKISRV